MNVASDALRGRRVLVTGAARGLGHSAAWALAKAGAECVLLDRLEKELLATAEAIRKQCGVPVHALVCDLTDRANTRQAAGFAKAAAGGDLCLLLHCAALLHRERIEETAANRWDETLAVNLTAAFLLVQALLPELRAGDGGSILLVSSRAGVLGFEKQSAYCASKFGAEGLAKSLAEECATDGVCANTITPGKRIKPTGLSLADEKAMSEEERAWESSGDLGPAFVAFALLGAGTGTDAPNGQRFRADRVAEQVRHDGLTLSPEAWQQLAE